MPKRTRSAASSGGEGAKKQKQPRGSPQTPKLLRRDSFGPESGVEPHTLICGTFPSDKSLGAGEYYANRESQLRHGLGAEQLLLRAAAAPPLPVRRHPPPHRCPMVSAGTNAFWWIVGDALGHRPLFFDAKGNRVPNPPANIEPHLLHPDGPERSYAERKQKLLEQGFVLWDVLKACERKGSTDAAIKKEVPQDIEGYCKRNPSIQRICLASGKTTASKFLRHNKSWLKRQPAELVLADNDVTKEVFGKAGMEHLLPGTPTDGQRICLSVMYSVSAAACNPKNPGSSYEEKRDQWLRDCFHAERRQE